MCWNIHRNDFILNRSKAPIHPEPADPSSNNDNPIAVSSNPPLLSVPGDSLGAPRSTGLDSSPVMKASETATEASEGQNPLALEVPRQAEDTDELTFVQDSAPISADTELRHNRHEMFSMIEGLRSSSPPVNTPNQPQFMTPPHLRSIRNAPDAEPPLTPTLAAISAENEDVFLGSSPTPGTRDRPQSSQPKTTSSQRKRHADAHTSKDPPSSPPELKSPSPNTHQRPESPTPNKSKRADPRGSRDEQSGRIHVNATPAEEPLTRRLRSSASKKFKPNAKSSKRAKSSASPEKTSTGPVQVENTQTKTRASKAKSDGNRSQVQEEPSQVIADSYSEDVESQVASQLEQDLELALDHNDKPKTGGEEQSAELPNSFPMTKKRKRDVEETRTPSKNEKRRSTRLSSSQPAAFDITPEGRSTRWKALASKSSGVSPTKPSPAQSASKRRASAKSKSAGQEEVADGNADSSSEVLESSQKRRRSSRLGGNTEQTATEETPSQRVSPRVTRSRKQEVGKEPCQEPSQNKDQAPDSNMQDETPGAEGTTVREAAGQDNEKEQEHTVEHAEVQESFKPDTPSQQIAETQPDIETDLAVHDVQTEQAPTETDVQMEDAEPNPQPEVSTGGDHDKEQLAATSEVTPQADIFRSFQQTLTGLQSTTLDESGFREIDEILFKIRVEAHDAFRRHTG